MSSLFEGFNLGDVVELRIRSYTLGPGPSAQLIAIALEVQRAASPDPELYEVDFGDEGPTLAQMRALVESINRRLRGRSGGVV